MKTPYYIALLLIIILSLAREGFSQNQPLPDGWRLPNDEESVDKWRPEGMAPYLVVEEDFNGDGVADEARILVRNDNSGIGLFVFLSDKGSYKTFQLLTLDSTKYILSRGIYPVEPGKYLTACGKGYYECEGDETEEIVLVNTSIDFFISESANMFFYWDSLTSSFKGVHISD